MTLCMINSINAVQGCLKIIPSKARSSTWDLIKIVWLQWLLFVCFLKDGSCSPQSSSIADSKGCQTRSVTAQRSTVETTLPVCLVCFKLCIDFIISLFFMELNTDYSSLVPKLSHNFNVTHRKGGGPGTQSHVWRVMKIDHDVS